MKKRVLIGLVMATLLLMVAIVEPALPWDPRVQVYPETPPGYYPTLHQGRGYYGYYRYYPYYPGHPSPNVDVRAKESWERDKGERSYEQSPNLPAKLIDAGTILWGMEIIFSR